MAVLWQSDMETIVTQILKSNLQKPKQYEQNYNTMS